MFTALHIDTNGRETLYECERVSLERHSESNAVNSTITIPGVLLDLTKGQEASRIHIPFCAMRSTGEKASPEVIVMNSNGKTVARYAL